MKSVLLTCLSLILVVDFATTAIAEEPVKASLNSTTEPLTKGQRIFSTGHSYHFGFPQILTEISKSGGYEDATIVGVSSIGGSTVIKHWSETKDTPAQTALKAGTVDVLMTTPIYIKPPDPGVENFAKLGFEHNPNFRLTMMEFWLPNDNYEPRNYSHGPKGSDTENIPRPAKVDHNAATVESLRKMHEPYVKEMDELVVDINKKLGKQVVYVVPVGQAVIALREKIIEGKAPGLKAQGDIFADDLGHPKMPLTIMIGYCHYAVIYRKNPVGLPVPKELDKEKEAEGLNRLLQELAWDAVIHHPLCGVKADGPAAPSAK